MAASSSRPHGAETPFFFYCIGEPRRPAGRARAAPSMALPLMDIVPQAGNKYKGKGKGEKNLGRRRACGFLRRLLHKMGRKAIEWQYKWQ